MALAADWTRASAEAASAAADSAREAADITPESSSAEGSIEQPPEAAARTQAAQTAEIIRTLTSALSISAGPRRPEAGPGARPRIF